MTTVGVDTIAAYGRICYSNQLAWSKGWQPPDAVLHSLNASGELSQCLCHDDGTVNTCHVCYYYYYYY